MDIDSIDFALVARPFKRPHKARTKRHKNLKAVMTDEQKRLAALPMVNKATYFSLEAPPSLRPAKHWCDITGLAGTYRSVRNGLRYHNKEIYDVIQGLTPGVDQQYLELRNANIVLR